MYKKLLVAPLVLSLALSTVAPNFAQAVETGTTEEVEKTNVFADAGTKVDFDLFYKGALSGYKTMFDVAYIKELGNNQYEITMKIPKMLTTFKVDSKLLTPVTTDGEYNIFKFTTSNLIDIPIYIEYDVGFYVGKHQMSIDMKYSKAMPAILENNILVGTYDQEFTEVVSRYDEGKYFITMNVANNISSMKFNDVDVAVVKKNEKNTIQVTLDTIEKEQLVTVSYDDGTTKKLTFDFTPSISEIKSSLMKAIEDGKEISNDTLELIINRLTYTTEQGVKNARALKLAVEELNAIDEISDEISNDLKKHVKYVAQKKSVLDYKTPYVNSVTEKINQLAYKETGSIKSKEDLTKAESQLAAAKVEIDTATAAGLSEKAYTLQNEQYVAQNVAITAYKAIYTTKLKESLDKLTYTTIGSIKTPIQLDEAHTQLDEAKRVISDVKEMGLTSKEVSVVVGYTKVASQEKVVNSGVEVRPVISFAGLATVNYDKSFTNVKYKKVENEYEVSMNVDNLFTTFKVNGENVTLKNESGIQKATFKIKDMNVNPIITISYTVNGYAASHDFKFDFTPSIAEIESDILQAVEKLTYAKNELVNNSKTYKAAVKELGYIEEAVKYKVSDEEVKIDVATIEQYKAQKQAVATYAQPFIDAVIEQLNQLTYENSESIKTVKDFESAKSQLEQVQTVIKKAVDAGLTEKKEIAAVDEYKKVLAQKATVDGYVSQLIQKAKDQLHELKHTKIASIKTMQDFADAKSQLLQVQETIQAAVATGVSEKDVFESLEEYKNIALQQAVLDFYKETITTKDQVVVKPVIKIPTTTSEEKIEEVKEVFTELLPETVAPVIKIDEESGKFEITLPFNITSDIKEIWINNKKVYPKADVVSPALLKARTTGTETTITFASTSLDENTIVVKKAQKDENGEEAKNENGELLLEEYAIVSSFVVQEKVEENESNLENGTNTGNNENSTNEGSNNSNSENNNSEEATEQAISYVFYYKGKESSYGSMFGSATSKQLSNGQYEIKLGVPNMISNFTVEGSSPEVVSNTGNMRIVKFTIPSLTSIVNIHIDYFIESMNFTGSHDMQIEFGQVPTGSSPTEEVDPDKDKEESNGETNTETEPVLNPGDYKVDTVLDNVVGDVEQYVSTDQQPSVSVTEQGEYNVSLPITNMDNVQSVEVNGVSIYTKTVLQKLASFFKPLSTTQVIHFTTKKLAGNEIKITTTDGALHSAKLSFANATKLDKVEENPDVDGEQKEEPVKEEPVKEEPVKDKVIQTVKPSKVTVANKKGAVDTVTVYSTTKGQIVKLYNAKGKVIAKQTAKSKTTKFTKLNLGKNAGTIFVTLQKPKQLESKKLKVAFKKEPVSTNIKSTSITIKNYKSKSDVITISGTAKGEVIYIYNAKGKQLKKVKATSKKTTIKIAQLGKSSGSIKVARIQSNKHISSKTIKKFSKEK